MSIEQDFIDAVGSVIDGIGVTERIKALEEAIFDTAGSASRQHYIDTGRYLTHAEVAEDVAAGISGETTDAFGNLYTYPIQHEQRRAIFGLLKRLGCDTFAREARLAAINAVLEHNGGQGVGSFVNLTEVQADEVITALETAAIVKEALA